VSGPGRRLETLGGWSVPWRTAPCTGACCSRAEGLPAPCHLGTGRPLMVSWAMWGKPCEAASPKVVIQMIFKLVIPYATLNQSFVKMFSCFVLFCFLKMDFSKSCG